MDSQATGRHTRKSQKHEADKNATSAGTASRNSISRSGHAKKAEAKADAKKVTLVPSVSATTWDVSSFYKEPSALNHVQNGHDKHAVNKFNMKTKPDNPVVGVPGSSIHTRSLYAATNEPFSQPLGIPKKVAVSASQSSQAKRASTKKSHSSKEKKHTSKKSESEFPSPSTGTRGHETVALLSHSSRNIPIATSSAFHAECSSANSKSNTSKNRNSNSKSDVARPTSTSKSQPEFFPTCSKKSARSQIQKKVAVSASESSQAKRASTKKSHSSKEKKHTSKNSESEFPSRSTGTRGHETVALLSHPSRNIPIATSSAFHAECSSANSRSKTSKNCKGNSKSDVARPTSMSKSQPEFFSACSKKSARSSRNAKSSSLVPISETTGGSPMEIENVPAHKNQKRKFSSKSSSTVSSGTALSSFEMSPARTRARRELPTSTWSSSSTSTNSDVPLPSVQPHSRSLGAIPKARPNKKTTSKSNAVAQTSAASKNIFQLPSTRCRTRREVAIALTSSSTSSTSSAGRNAEIPSAYSRFRNRETVSNARPCRKVASKSKPTIKSSVVSKTSMERLLARNRTRREAAITSSSSSTASTSSAGHSHSRNRGSVPNIRLTRKAALKSSEAPQSSAAKSSQPEKHSVTASMPTHRTGILRMFPPPEPEINPFKNYQRKANGDLVMSEIGTECPMTGSSDPSDRANRGVIFSCMPNLLQERSEGLHSTFFSSRENSIASGPNSAPSTSAGINVQSNPPAYLMQEPKKTLAENSASSSASQSTGVDSLSGNARGCCICLDDESELQAIGSSITSMRCGHLICNVCWNKLIERYSRCPVCRTKLFENAASSSWMDVPACGGPVNWFDLDFNYSDDGLDYFPPMEETFTTLSTTSTSDFDTDDEEDIYAISGDDSIIHGFTDCSGHSSGSSEELDVGENENSENIDAEGQGPNVSNYSLLNEDLTFSDSLEEGEADNDDQSRLTTSTDEHDCGMSDEYSGFSDTSDTAVTLSDATRFCYEDSDEHSSYDQSLDSLSNIDSCDEEDAPLDRWYNEVLQGTDEEDEDDNDYSPDESD